MGDTRDNPGETAGDAERTTVTPQPASAPAHRPRKSLSMHENVPVWYDCCSCEAEPYWAELAGESAEEPAAEPSGPDGESTMRGKRPA